MAITSNRVSLRELISRNEQNFVVLPNFQRKFVWKEGTQKALIASVLADLPIGSLLILKGSTGDFAARALCFEKEVMPKEECEYVLDGQQRLSTLKTAFFDLFSSRDSWKLAWDGMFQSLRTRWFIDLEPENVPDDCFGFKLLSNTKLNTYEQDDLTPFLRLEKIHKTKTDLWFHPGYSPKDANGAAMGDRERSNKIATQAAKQKLVPLYELEKKEKGIHHLVLARVAKEQSEKLAAQCADGKLNIKDILGPDVNPSDEEEVQKAWIRLESNWVTRTAFELERIIDREITTISLDKSEIKRAVCIFEAVNRGGTALAVYDLIVARSAREQRESLTERIKRTLLSAQVIPEHVYDESKIKAIRSEGWTSDWIMAMDAESEVPSKEMQPQIVNMLSLVAYCKNSESTAAETPSLSHIKKDKHLSLSSKQINESVDLAMQSLARAFAFLQLRCGIKTINDISYSLMILPIAYVLFHDEHWNNPQSLNKIERWYWISLFGGRYRERQNETCIDDISALFNWCEGKKSFDLRSSEARILNYEGYSDKAILLRDDPEQRVPSAITDGILQFILASEPFDFDTNSPRISAWAISAKHLQCEIHHLIPLKHAARLSDSTAELRRNGGHVLNSPLNFTWISREKNRSIGAQSPADYIKWLPQQSLPEHCLPSASAFTISASTSDDAWYRAILERRYDSLRDAVQRRLNSLSK